MGVALNYTSLQLPFYDINYLEESVHKVLCSSKHSFKTSILFDRKYCRHIPWAVVHLSCDLSLITAQQS